MDLRQNDMDLLERKYSMYLILLVDKNPGLTKTDLMGIEKGNEKTKFRRMTELVEAGIFCYRKKGNDTSRRIYLTAAGAELTSAIRNLRTHIIELDRGPSP